MPEVESVRWTLAPKLVGRRIEGVEILLPRLIKLPSVRQYQKDVTGKRIESIGRRGKYLLVYLEDNWLMVFHLRMTGSLCYMAKEKEKGAHERVIYALDNGDRLVFSDLRTFGTLYLIKKGEEERIAGLFALGAEPLSEEFTVSYLKKRLVGRRGKIKTFLLDQRQVAGLGNIYVDEALFLSGINPLRRAGDLSEDEITRLHAAIEKVIAAGIADGGTTFRDYVDGEGKKGHHQEKLFVYSRAGEKCRLCGEKIVKVKIAGRGSCYCPHCQKEKKA